MGPTTEEIAQDELRYITEQIASLEDRKRTVLARLRQYRGSRMLESERRATAAEPYQRTQLASEEHLFGD